MEPVARRDFGLTWQQRLEEARARGAAVGPALTAERIAQLQVEFAAIDVSSSRDQALLWSGKDVLTGVPLDEASPQGQRWWDKLACREAEVFRALGLAQTLEDTPGGKYMLGLGLNYPEADPLCAIA